MAGYFAELHRRNVFRAVSAFVVGGWLLLQVATALEEAMDLPVWFDTVVAAALLVALPVVIVISWVYELTPEGLQKTTDIDAQTSIAPKTGRRLDAITLAGVALVIGLFGYQQLRPESDASVVTSTAAPATNLAPTAQQLSPAQTNRPEGQIEKSIAVLPFVAMTVSKDDELFADGLSEELLNVLAGIKGLKVAGRTSSFYYKNKNEDLRKIAGALGVAHILEGSVRRSGETLRVTAQLIQADDGFHLWSETFDRADGDTFAIQDEIASSVAKALRAELIGDKAEPESSPRNIDAQNLYLVAQAALAQRNLSDVKRARDLFDQARKLAPETPRYAAGYAHATALLFWNFRAISPDEAISEAAKAIDQAMQSGTPSADTLAIAGLVEELRVITVSDPEAKQRALNYYQQAMDLDLGNILAMQWLASINLDLNQYAQAKQYFQRVIELDPLNVLALSGLAQAQVFLGELEAGRNRLYQMQQLFPGTGQAPRYLALLEFNQGQLDRSVYWNQREQDVDPNPSNLFFLAIGYLYLGEQELARSTAVQLKNLDDNMDISGLIEARIRGDFATVAGEADRLFVQTGQDVFAVASAYASAMIGQYAQTIRTLEQQFPSLKGTEAQYIDGTDIQPVVLLAYSYRQRGDQTAARRLAELVLDHPVLSETSLLAIPQLRMVRAELFAAMGDDEAAVRTLTKLQQENIGIAFNPLAIRAQDEPMYAGLRDHPNFQAFVTFESDTLKQQAAALVSGTTANEIKAEIEAAGYRLAGQ